PGPATWRAPVLSPARAVIGQPSSSASADPITGTLDRGRGCDEIVAMEPLSPVSSKGRASRTRLANDHDTGARGTGGFHERDRPRGDNSLQEIAGSRQRPATGCERPWERDTGRRSIGVLFEA